MRLLAAALLVVPLGCGRADAIRPAAPVLAKVNGAEISSPDTPSAQALERIIDRELLVQQALEAGLDRDPQVRASIDEARRRLLAQAWLERRGAGAKSTRAEVRAFYEENPALFAGRRIYRLRSLAVPAGDELLDLLRSKAAGAAALEQIAAWLRARGASFTLETTTQPAERLPLGQLPQLARMREGEIAVFAAAPGARVVELLGAEEAPLGEEEAAPLIEKFLAGRRRLELAAAEAKRLRRLAAIEYLGNK